MASSKRRIKNESTVPEIKMTREIKLKVGWKELSSKLGEVVAQGFLTAFGGDELSAGISALMGAVSSVKIDAEPGEKAWSLGVLCFAWALDELKTLPGTDIPALRKTLDDALAEAKAQVDDSRRVCAGYVYWNVLQLCPFIACSTACILSRERIRSDLASTNQTTHCGLASTLRMIMPCLRSIRGNSKYISRSLRYFLHQQHRQPSAR